MRSRPLLFVSLALIACDSKKPVQKSPAETASALVGDDVSPLDVASALPAGVVGEPWDPALCDVVPEGDKTASRSDVRVSGACSFTHHGTALCDGTGDDYTALFQRGIADGSSVNLYVNVEGYSGAATYDKNVQVLVAVRRGDTLYRWSNDQATATLGSGEGGGVSSTPHNVPESQGATPTILRFPPTELLAQPGTPARGTIKVEGTIACVLKKKPK